MFVAVVQRVAEHWGDYLVAAFTGASGLGALAHGLNTFPPPDNKYGRWALGWAQFIIGELYT